MQDRLSTYDEKVLRRLIQLETARRQEGRQAPLAFIKRDTEAGAAMRRLDQMGMIGAIYKEGNPYVVEVLAKGYSYVGYIDSERAEIQRIERHRQEDRRHDWLVSVFTVLVAMVGVIAGFLIGHFHLGNRAFHLDEFARLPAERRTAEADFEPPRPFF